MIIGISGRKQSGKDTVSKAFQYLAARLYEESSFSDYMEFDKENPLEKRASPAMWTGGWENKKFAEKLKQIVCILIGCKREDLEDDVFKNTPLPEEWDRWRIKVSMIHDDSRHVNTKTLPKLFATEEEAENEYIDIPARYNYIGKEIYREQLTPRLLLQWIGTEGLRDIIHPQVHVLSLFTEYKPISSGKVYIEDLTGDKVAKLNEETLAYSYENFPKWIITDVRFPNEADAIRERGGFVIRVNNPRVINNDNHPSETSLDDYKEFDAIINNDDTLEELLNKVKNVVDNLKITL